jgi:hypothetical protein
MDRGYIDFARLCVFTLCAAFFVVRTKKNVLLRRRYSREVDKSRWQVELFFKLDQAALAD